MFTILLIIHLLTCVMLIGVVLMQSGKGGLGSALGGGESFFGGRGAAPFLTRATTVLAVVFMMTSLSLALISGKQTRSATAIEKAVQQDQHRSSSGTRSGESPLPSAPAAPAVPGGK
ncbi:MAG TPA: preprotein translocase subunit SecG [Candidatus Edwardsbacteria bacterium]|nr:preprotein translocase subunit SecG [Candidatus Edwardsbacteria bacterium]